MQLTIDTNRLAQVCRAYGIRRLALFGSVLRSDFRDDSDVDVLVEFAAGAPRDCFRLARMEEELSPLLGGHRVDLVTVKSLNHRLRDRILAEAETKYDER
jgi:predicted nucleotidyltransferase